MQFVGGIAISLIRIFCGTIRSEIQSFFVDLYLGHKRRTRIALGYTLESASIVFALPFVYLLLSISRNP